MNIPSLCFNCMNTIQHRAAVCPNCGYDNTVRHNGKGMLREWLLDGKYLVGRFLGRGGFGITYIGFDLERGCRVAIKEYYPSKIVYRAANSVGIAPLQGSEEAFEKGKQKALKEGSVAAGLGHIHGVVQIYKTFCENNTVYIAMEYIHGGTLKDYVANYPGRLTLQETLSLLAPVANALNKLHEQNVVHRDVKPDNITVRKTLRQGVLLDFGAARIVDDKNQGNTSSVVTPGYAPPEQYNAGKLDGRMDQYAFAATLFFTLTGNRPPDVMERIAQNDKLPSICAINPTITPEKEKVIFKAMSIAEKDRYPTIADMWWELRGAGGNQKKMKKKNSTGRIVAVVLAILILLGTIAYYLISSGGIDLQIFNPGSQTKLWFLPFSDLSRKIFQ